jgi:hypothetical protein
VRLDIHIYPIINFDLLLGFPLAELLGTSQGSLDEKFRETTSTTSCLKNPMPKLQQNPLDTAMPFSPFVSAELTSFEGSEPSAPQKG